MTTAFRPDAPSRPRGKGAPALDRSKIQEWASHRRYELATASAALSLGPAGEVLANAPDGWRTAAVLGVLGTSAAGAYGWFPGLALFNRFTWKRSLPSLRRRILALSAPVTGSALLTTMAATGGPEWGQNPLWGLSLLWAAAYGTTGIYCLHHPSAPPPVMEDAPPVLTDQVRIWLEHVAKSGGAYPKSELHAVLPIKQGGWTGEVLVPRGDVFEILPDKIASAYDVDSTLVAMERPRTGSPRRGKVTIMTHNPLQQGTLFDDSHVLDPETGIAPVGLFYDTEVATYRFFQPGSGVIHSFVTGTSGSGKSRFLDALLAIERRSPLVVSVVIDPQGGQSLPDWPEGVSLYAPSVELGIQVLRAVQAEVNDRSARYGRMKWTDERGRTRIGRAHFVPGDPDPILSVTVDEAHQLLMHEEYGQEAATIIADLAKRARKCGVKIRLANQSPNASQLGGDTVIRDILQGGNNVVLRSGSSATGRRAAGSALDGVDPGKIAQFFPDGSGTGGLGYIAGPDSRAAMFRASYVADPYGLAREGETMHWGGDSLKIDIVRHVLEEGQRYLACRANGTEYHYDPNSYTPDSGGSDHTPPGNGRSKSNPRTPTAPAAATAEKITDYLKGLGRPSTPAAIAAAIALPGPAVRQSLTRMKTAPDPQVVTTGFGAWVHTDHAKAYIAPDAA